MRIVNNRGSEMVMCLGMVLLASNVTALAQPPDNAALLYYQAFLLHEEPNETMDMMITEFRNGQIVSNEGITRYIERNRRVIDLVVTAANISKCDWGYDYSLGMDMRVPNLPSLQRITFLLAVEVRWLAEQGNFPRALDRCVTVRKVALHACEGRMLVVYLYGTTINRRANGIIEDILGLMPGDVDELKRLRSRLIRTQSQFPSLASFLMQEAQMNAAMMHKDKVQPIVDLFEGSLGAPSLDRMLKRIREGDGTFFERNRDYYLKAMATFVTTLESGLPYTEIYAGLDDLPKQWSQEAEDNPDATLTSLSLPDVTSCYRSVTRQETHVNALKTAIDLYIVKARTGQLPDTLPANQNSYTG